MDLLESGSERPPSRLAVAVSRLPARVVAAGLALVLAAGVLGAGQVRRDQREADDVSGLALELVVEHTRRAGDGSAYGFARLDVVDPAGRPVELLDVDVDVPGLRLGRQGLSVQDLEPAPVLLLPLRFAVPDCGEVELPGRLSVHAARPGRPGARVSAQLGGAAAALRRACGLPAG